ncbi:MAG: MATE family efflux transporter, partial [Porcipelethomonas sp.]
VFYPVLGVLFILRNALQGMGYSVLPMMAGVSELAARTLVVFGFVSSYGYMAACLASPVAWIFADVLLVSVYFLKMRSLRNELVFHKRATA